MKAFTPFSGNSQLWSDDFGRCNETLGFEVGHGLKREEALLLADSQSGISMTALATELGLLAGRVSQLIKKAQTARKGE